MISADGKWYYVALITVSAWLIGIISRLEGDFYCFNCHHPFRTKNQLDSHERVSINQKHCQVVLPNEDFGIQGIEKINMDENK